MRIISVAKRRKSLSALGLLPFPDLSLLGEGASLEWPRTRGEREGGDGRAAGDPKLLLDAELCIRKGLRAGQELDETTLMALIAESARERAKAKAIWLLSRRDYGERELAGKLEKDFGADAAAYAAGRMRETGLVDDRRYAARLAAQLLEVKKVSPKQAVYLMVQRGMDRELAEDAVEERSPDPTEQIRQIVRQKYGRGPWDQKEIRRMTAGLARRGFSFGDIRSILRELSGDEYLYEE